MVAHLTRAALAIMFVAFVLGIFSTSIYDASPDPTKTQFHLYSEVGNKSSLQTGNLSYTNTNNSVSNLQLISNNIMQAISNSQRDLQSTDAFTQLTAAFGLTSTVILNILVLILGVVLEGINLVAGIGANIVNIPPPWGNVAAMIIPFALAIIIVYLVFRLVSAFVRWDV